MNYLKPIIVFIVLVFILPVCYWLVISPIYFDYQIEQYKGEGFIKNISSRALIFPIEGYAISFDTFELSKPFSRMYKLNNLPAEGVVIYLSLKDPDNTFGDDEKISKLNAKVEFLVSKSTGEELLKFENYLSDMVWSSPIIGYETIGHALYDSRKSNQRSWFIASKGNSYKLSIKYYPDSKLENYEGFLYLRSGGTI